MLLAVIAFVAFLVLVYGLLGVRYIPNRKVGIVEKRWSLRGSIETGFIARRGEAGFQPAVLRGGVYWLPPLQYRVHLQPLVTIPQGKVGYVFARDGVALSPTQTLASNATAADFEDVSGFLEHGGQRGPQRKILREGTFAINLVQFVVITQEKRYYLPLHKDDSHIFETMASLIRDRDGFVPVVVEGAEDRIGIVTIHDGPSLEEGAIIAPVVGRDVREPETYHNNFQDPERFLLAGGRRGRQLQVLVDGTYYLNALFATVELVQKTVIDVGSVGVVVWYAGAAGSDLSGSEYKHGELVGVGERGVWGQPLLPGKYAFNSYAGRVVPVPTTNFILKWIRTEAGEHRYDENLAEVSLITKDAFEPSLPLSVVVHIDYKKAPLVVQRFGDIRRLVEQTLDPMVAAYFKNVGQTRTLIQLLQERSEIQWVAGDEMRSKFSHYNLELEEVLIGTPTSGNGDGRIEQILAQLRSRQIAEEQVETFARQEKAAQKERELREAEARAKNQERLTTSDLEIVIHSNQGKAEYQRSIQEAARIRALAEADADRIRVTAEAEAERAARVGIGQAMAIQEQVRAYGGPQFQLARDVLGRFADAIQVSGVDVVPRVLIGHDGASADGRGATGGSVFEALLALLLSERVAGAATGVAPPAADPEADTLRQRIRRAIAGQEGAL